MIPQKIRRANPRDLRGWVGASIGTRTGKIIVSKSEYSERDARIRRAVRPSAGLCFWHSDKKPKRGGTQLGGKCPGVA